MNGVGRILVGALLANLVACGGGEEEDDSKTNVIEMFSWWTAGGEKQALDAMLEMHVAKHPDAKIINVAQEGGGTVARELLEARIRDGNPPEVFQTNLGLALRNWLEFNGADAPAISPLDDLLAEQGWNEAYPELLLDAVRVDGKIYGVPVNIHRTNALFYNVHVFEENNLEPPTTLEEFYAVGEQLLALDPPIVPLAVGSKGAWTVNLLMMENLLITKAGPEYYKTFFTGGASPDDPEIVDTLQEMLTIWNGYVNDNANALEWDGAVKMVADGEAAMTIMGDWAKGYLENAGLVPGADFRQVPTFGSEGAFVFTGDCFALPADTDNPEGGTELLKTFGSREAQDEFNRLKGSIPARIDADVSAYDSQAQATAKDFGSVTLVSSLAAFVPPAFGDAVVGAIPDMLDGNDPEPVLQVLRDNYDLLGQ